MLRSNLGRAAAVIGFITALVGGSLIWLPTLKSGGSDFEPVAGAAIVPSIASETWTPSFEPIIDYSDPVGRAVVPLRYVEGRRHELISETVYIWEVASRDGAPFARISQELLEAIDAIRAETDAEITVLSGYRHLHRNALAEIGGARESQHVAGLAADLSSDELESLELAELILDVVGCEIGLGLGVMAVHFDLRGYRSVWARAGSEFESEEFAEWVATHCGDEPESSASECHADEPCEDIPDETDLVKENASGGRDQPADGIDVRRQIAW